MLYEIMGYGRTIWGGTSRMSEVTFKFRSVIPFRFRRCFVFHLVLRVNGIKFRCSENVTDFSFCFRMKGSALRKRGLWQLFILRGMCCIRFVVVLFSEWNGKTDDIAFLVKHFSMLSMQIGELCSPKLEVLQDSVSERNVAYEVNFQTVYFPIDFPNPLFLALFLSPPHQIVLICASKPRR